jgi:micrococcal nuclease
LERDVEGRDRYGRLLVYVHRASDELFVNLALIDGGWAATLSIPPNTALAQQFAAAAARARAAGKGLWTACGGPDEPAAAPSTPSSTPSNTPTTDR